MSLPAAGSRAWTRGIAIFLDVLRGPAAFPLFALSTMLFLLFMAWITAAWLIYLATLGTAEPEAARSVWTFLQAVVSTPAGWKMIVIGNLVGLFFVILALAISVVSFPMVVDKPALGAGDALRTSFQVARQSPVTVAIWGLIVATMLVVGSLPAFIGLAVVLPVLGYSTWHLYTRRQPLISVRRRALTWQPAPLRPQPLVQAAEERSPASTGI